MNRILYLWVSLLFMAFTQNTNAQHKLQGKVMDANGKYPLQEVAVMVENTILGTNTDAQGNFEIPNVSFPLNLKISHVGYETITLSLKEAPKDFVVRLTEQPHELEEIVVVSFEGSKKLKETPAAISSIGQRDINRYNLTSPQQALNTLPGIKLESTTLGRYSLKIRGGNLGAIGHADGYKTYWNGIPISLATGNIPLGQLDFGSIGSMNIVRGPSGSIYGAGLSGVALLENRKPLYKQTSFQTDFLGASYGTYRYGATFATSGQNSDLHLQYSKLHTDGYRNEAASDNEFINLNARFFPSEKQSLSLITQYVDRSYGIPGNLSAEQVVENPRQSTFSRELDNGLRGKSLLVGAGHTYRFNNRWENSTSFSYQVYEGDFLIGNDFFMVADRSITTAFSARTATTYRFDGFFGKENCLVFGGEYTRGINDVNEFSNGFQSPIISARTSTDRSFLGFSQLEMELPEDFTLTLGASYNNFQLDFEERLVELDNPRFSKEVNDFSPRIALTKKINDAFFVYANISKGFSPPPRGAFDNNGTQLNFDLESTKGWNKELGIRGTTFKNRLSFDAVFYRLDVKDVILPRIASNIGGVELVMNENAGAIDRQGIELRTEYFLVKNSQQFLSRASVFGSYTYMDHKFETYNTVEINENGETNEINFDKKNIPGIHPHTLVVGTDIVTKPGLYFNGTFSYYDKVYLNNANTITDNPYRLFDAKLGFKKTLTKDFFFDVFVGGNNILGDTYSATHQYNSSFGAYYDPAPGRNFYSGASLRYIF
ncbi:hypothetical protein SY27_10310 [Flavobacterium sp. 316]|uniref:TonB-dependent receptor n=1 Tax=Flavobacterium sp. 316 TaxID=1603293 RepID=UPI0005E3616E|nr:TonB-dependent receptor [Flavobacterium sp. 316]KIX21146.1 hypothetical protein SY27_10310 [Flavobacterium sp. 316]